MIDRLDQNIGRLTKTLKDQGKLNNTLILFTSDNGGSSEVVNISGGTGAIGSLTNWKSLGKNWANVSNTPYREYKNWSHEGGIKTPLIAYWPDKIKNKGSIVHKPVHLIDFMPTLQEVIGAAYPKNFNGESILPSPGQSFLSQMLGNGSQERDGPIFWEWRHGKAIREEIGNWWPIVMSGNSTISKMIPLRKLISLIESLKKQLHWKNNILLGPINSLILKTNILKVIKFFKNPQSVFHTELVCVSLL